MAFATITACAAEPVETAAAVTARYQQAVAQARDGQTATALETLRALVAQYPQRRDLINDYAVVLGWAGEHAAALALLDRIDRSTAPGYVIEGFAGSARALHQFEFAESLYREAVARDAARVEPQLGLALTLAEAGKLDDASQLIERLRLTYPQRIDVLEAYAAIAVLRHDDFAALAAYQAILQQQPTHRNALRGKIQTLSRLGTPQLGIEIADQNPGVLTADERAAIAADRTAHQIRWGAIAAGSERGTARFAVIDAALADSDAAGARALDRNNELSPVERQLALDRIGALRERYRMREAVALYEALAARPLPLPAYAQSAAASAYLYLEQPEKARDLYRAALVSDPANLETRIGLFYALAESEDHAAALTEIDAAVAATPQWMDAWSPATVHENPAYARVLSARAMAPLFANRVGEAEQRLHVLSDRVPYNMEVRTDYASTMRARGWPRKAERELTWILAADPDNSGALGEHAGALLEMRDYRKAEAALALAQAVAAEDGRVVRATRLAQVHDMRELIVDATVGRSSGGPSGTQDYAVDTRLYSSPFDYNYRVFAHAFNAEAKLDNGTGRRNRIGGGLEYRSTLFTASGELSQGINEGNTGAAAALAYTPDDYWTFRGTLDSSSNAVPLQASLAGINARRGSAEAVWQAHESRSAALGYARMNFSDGNHRDSLQARWTERVIVGPVYKLEITGGLYASHNSLANTPYFNPSNDFSPTLEFSNEWLQWRRYTRAFRHRLVATVGSYSQQGFASGPVYGARYEQEWDADDRLTVRYGIGRTLHPYDGVQTARNFLNFALNWRF
jgi:biofilm PGA synthesis protein PgaA